MSSSSRAFERRRRQVQAQADATARAERVLLLAEALVAAAAGADVGRLELWSVRRGISYSRMPDAGACDLDLVDAALDVANDLAGSGGELRARVEPFAVTVTYAAPVTHPDRRNVSLVIDIVRARPGYVRGVTVSGDDIPGGILRLRGEQPLGKALAKVADAIRAGIWDEPYDV